MNINQEIEKANYVVSEHDVELLAAEHLANAGATNRTEGSYLRILIAGLQAQYGTARRRKLQADDQARHVGTLGEMHGKMYPHVLLGVTTPEVADDEKLAPDTRRQRAGERNRRAAFARSSASTLKTWILAGGDVRTLDVRSVTKTELRAFTRAHRDPVAAVRDPAHAATVSLMSRLRALATTNPDAARQSAEEALTELRKVLEELERTPRLVGQQVDPAAFRVDHPVFQRRRGATQRQRTATA